MTYSTPTNTNWQNGTFHYIHLQRYLLQTCQLPWISRESHRFLQFLQSHSNSCSQVYSCPTVLFSHRLLPINLTGNTFWQHLFSVKNPEACYFPTGNFRGATKATYSSALSCLDRQFVVGIERHILSEFVTRDSTSRRPNRYSLCIVYYL